MSQIVLDASVALAFLLPDESSAAALSVREELLTAEFAWVAGHWKLEVCNALWSAERRKRLNPAGVAQAVFLVSQLPLEIDPETNAKAGAETLALARQFDLTVYDAAYLELALRRGAKLATLDQKLRSTAHSLGITVLPPSDRS